MSRRPVRAGLIAVAAVAIGLAGVVVLVDGDDGSEAVARRRTATTTTTTTTMATSPPAPVPDEGFLVADAAVAQVPLFDGPDVPAADGLVLDNPTWEGLAVVFQVLEERGEWLRVRVSARPNERTNWVRRSDVAVRSVPNRVVIDVDARRVTVFRGRSGEVVLETSAAVGTSQTPTPLGRFFVDGRVRTTEPGGVYGPFQVSVAGFSEELFEFDGGIGQIAMHGTNRPDQLGRAVSNGCIRMNNDAISRVVHLAVPGTPVEIVA